MKRYFRVVNLFKDAGFFMLVIFGFTFEIKKLKHYELLFSDKKNSKGWFKIGKCAIGFFAPLKYYTVDELKKKGIFITPIKK